MNSTATAGQAAHDRKVGLWLLLCAAVIFGMVLLGGVTRLTNSGLSMVEWRPLMGVVPPLSEQAWAETFDKYRQYPEYQQLNRGMSLAEFKVIFMYEYLHRVLGRLIGVLFLVPFLYFLVRGYLRPGLTPRLLGLFCLGGLQGLLGWYMVKSGLVDVPYVSQYRLAAHLGLAVIIYGLMLWLAFGLLGPGRVSEDRAAARWRGLSLVLVAALFVMILSGALVAGTHAGHAYNTWPLMGSSFIPAGLYQANPAWLSAFEDLTTIQFNHRMLAYLLFIAITALVVLVLKSGTTGRARSAAIFLQLALLLQVGLGISTLVLGVPVAIAAAHQGGALVLLSCLLWLTHTLTLQRRWSQAPALQSAYTGA
jgi:cytochrome c oxidase assembly protein subunit 15